MLQSIRDKATGWLAYLIIALISIPFALVGINSYFGGGDGNVAAIVNGEEVPAYIVQNAVLQQRQRLAQIFGKLPPGMSDDVLKQQALEQTVNQTLIRQQAEQNGYRVSSREVFDFISDIPAFQKDGKFDVGTYERTLAAQRRNKLSFESEVRTSLSNDQFSQSVVETAFLPLRAVESINRLQNQKRDIEAYTFKVSDAEKETVVSDEKIKAYYDDNHAAFMTDEQVKLNYLSLKEADIAASITPTDEEVQQYYDNNLDLYRTAEQVKVSHLLVKIHNDDDAALAKAQGFYDKIQADPNQFDELAKTESDDKFAADKKGEIGFIAPGDMGPLFEKAAFALNVGEISEPVKTEAGYEIIKLTDKKDAEQKALTEVKSDVEAAIKKVQAEKQFLEQSERLQTLAFENDSSLDAAAAALEMEVSSSNWVKRQTTEPAPDAESGLENHAKVIAAAFSDEVLNAGKNSEMLEIDPTHMVVLRLQEHQRPELKSLDSVSADIRAILANQKARKAIIAQGEAALKGLNETGDWNAVSNIKADDVKKHESVARNGGDVAAEIAEAAFQMVAATENNVSVHNTLLPNGDYVLIKLNQIKSEAEEASDAVQTALARSIGGREQAAMLKVLRDSADVQLFPENIQ